MKPVSITLSPKIKPAAPPTSAINAPTGYVGVSRCNESVSSKILLSYIIPKKLSSQLKF